MYYSTRIVKIYMYVQILINISALVPNAVHVHSPCTVLLQQENPRDNRNIRFIFQKPEMPTRYFPF